MGVALTFKSGNQKKKKNKTTLAGLASSVGSAGQSQECVALTFESGDQKKKKKKKQKTRPLWLGWHQVSGPQAKVTNVWHRLSKVEPPKKKKKKNKTTLAGLASSVG